MPHPQDRPPDNLETEGAQTVEMDLDEGMGIFIKRGSVTLDWDDKS